MLDFSFVFNTVFLQNQKGKLRNKEYDLVFSSGEEATHKKDLLVDLVSKSNIISSLRILNI